MIENIDYIRGNQNFNPLIFLPAALCDMIATSLMYLGLVMTTAPSFQMLRGNTEPPLGATFRRSNVI